MSSDRLVERRIIEHEELVRKVKHIATEGVSIDYRALLRQPIKGPYLIVLHRSIEP
jgi:hypothetical protein